MVSDLASALLPSPGRGRGSRSRRRRGRAPRRTAGPRSRLVHSLRASRSRFSFALAWAAGGAAPAPPARRPAASTRSGLGLLERFALACRAPSSVPRRAWTGARARREAGVAARTRAWPVSARRAAGTPCHRHRRVRRWRSSPCAARGPRSRPPSSSPERVEPLGRPPAAAARPAQRSNGQAPCRRRMVASAGASSLRFLSAGAAGGAGLLHLCFRRGMRFGHRPRRCGGRFRGRRLERLASELDRLFGLEEDLARQHDDGDRTDRGKGWQGPARAPALPERRPRRDGARLDRLRLLAATRPRRRAGSPDAHARAARRRRGRGGRRCACSRTRPARRGSWRTPRDAPRSRRGRRPAAPGRGAPSCAPRRPGS